MALVTPQCGPGWRIENDVVVTDSGVAFLAGGNQNPLQYATGELSPTAASLKAFAANIASRASHSGSRTAEYVHVIFPDKQSILVEEFPFHPLVQLGEVYLDYMGPDASARVVYPVAELRAAPDSCLRLDTHLSHAGSLVVLRSMLDAVGIDAGDALDHIGARIVHARRSSGDLGSKLDPERFEDALLLSPDWRYEEFNSGGGFNDGMIDVLFSPDAPIDRTVLLFGDSFFRLMLKHLNGIFTRVVCLRTRFYHREMVELIEPDLIFSGNAERYLARVFSDDNAIPFALYRASRGIFEPFTPEFLEAWRSVSSPRASQSKTYLGLHGVGRRAADT